MKLTAANGVGFASIGCSLAFWLWACLTLFTPFGHDNEWVVRVAVAFWFWILVWALGILLGFVAAVRGSKRWLFAALFAFASCGVAFWLVSGIEW